jgi:hypothetical protein
MVMREKWSNIKVIRDVIYCNRRPGNKTAGAVVTFACGIRNCFVTVAWWWSEWRPEQGGGEYNLGIKKGKAVPLQAWSGPEGSRKLRFRYFMTTAQDGGKISLIHRPPLPPVNTPGTHLNSATRRIMSLKNSNDTNENRTCDMPVCSAVP